MWAVAAARGKFGALPSDHLPVTVRLMKKPAARSAPVVRPWVARIGAFSEAVEKLWKLRAVSSAVGSPAELKDCFRAAAREVAVGAEAHVRGLLETRLYAATLMVRAVRSLGSRAVRCALSLFPTLARFVDPLVIRHADVDGLHLFIARLNRADVENDLASMARGCNDEGVRVDCNKDVKKANVLRRSCAWGFRRPRVQLRSIVGAEWELASSPEEAGKILAGHWQLVFEARQVDEGAAGRFLSHVCAVGGGSILSFLARSLGSASLPRRTCALVLVGFRMLFGEELGRLLPRSRMGLLRLCLEGVRTSPNSSTRPTWFSSLRARSGLGPLGYLNQLLALVLLACLTLTRRFSHLWSIVISLGSAKRLFPLIREAS